MSHRSPLSTPTKPQHAARCHGDTGPRNTWRCLLGWTLASATSLALLSGCGSSTDNATTPTNSTPASNTGDAGGSAKTSVTSELGQLAVNQINAIRASARSCGGVSFGAAAPIAWNDKVESSALVQADYMQTSDSLTHTGSGGSTLGDRVSAAGYSWAGVAENIGWGYASLDEVLQGWLESPGHCANLMSPDYSEIGIGQSGSGSDAYWALVLARPRS